MIDVKSFNYHELEEDIKTEVERIFTTTMMALCANFMITNEYPLVHCKDESAPIIAKFFLDVTGHLVTPGFGYMNFVRLHMDEANKPVFQVLTLDKNQSEVADGFVRFPDADELLAMHYKRNRDSLIEKIKEDLNASMIVPADFTIAACAACELRAVYFGIQVH